MKRQCLIHDLRSFTEIKRQKIADVPIKKPNRWQGILRNSSQIDAPKSDDKSTTESNSDQQMIDGTISIRELFSLTDVELDKMDQTDSDYQPVCDKFWALSDDEMAYFNKLDDKSKQCVLHAQEQIKLINTNEVPPKIKVLLSSIPLNAKEKILQRIDTFQLLDPSTEDYNTQSQWINRALSIPFDIYKPLKFVHTGTDECAIQFTKYLQSAKTIMDNKLYGQSKIKEILLDFIAKKVRTNGAANKFLAFEGPPGVGKTTLIREGVATALGLDFIFISLGGANDGGFLEGDREVWRSAQPGRIVDALVSTRSMNPIFMFDELDKISNTDRGKEIINIISALTDPIQNKEFHDQYFQDLSFDLSQTTMLFTFNDRSCIPRYLLDRLEIYTFEDYTKSDKLIIAKKYMIPAIAENLCLTDEQIHISDDIYEKIITAHASEKGCRGIRKCLDRIYEQSLRKIMTTPNTEPIHISWKNNIQNTETRLPYYS
jgi:ATP-dependent Lon protease